MTDLVARLTDQILGDDLDKAELSATWPAVLAFLGDAVAFLGDTRRARSPPPPRARLLRAQPPRRRVRRTAGQRRPDHRPDRVRPRAGQRRGVLRRRPRHGPTHERAAARGHHDERARRTPAAARRPTHRCRGGRGPARDLARSHGWRRLLRRVGPASDESDSAPGSTTGESGSTTLDGDPAGTTTSAGVPAGRSTVTRPIALIDPLTSREVQVLTLVAQGLRNSDIARRLVISEYTAANHVRSILMKTGSANRTQAARFATIHALIDQGEPPAVSRRPPTPPR